MFNEPFKDITGILVLGLVLYIKGLLVDTMFDSGDYNGNRVCQVIW